MVWGCDFLHRSLFLAIAVTTAGFPSAPAVSAQIRLLPTPALAEGPFYPKPLPTDRDNDLIPAGKRFSPEAGEIAHLSGRILWQTGEPVAGATIEIWQCDAHGVYPHSDAPDNETARPAERFQGFGTFTTGASGEYRFRTLKPVVDTHRSAPHIHYKVKVDGCDVLTSRMFIRGEPLNRRDATYNTLRGLLDRELVLGDFQRHPEVNSEWTGRFDIVLGDLNSSPNQQNP